MLATEIRPRTLNDIVGQDTIVKGLKNYFKNKNLPNVNFFTGNSGCGKNTFANIVAATLVCDKPITEEDGSISPCCKCPSCKDIIEERFQNSVRVYNGSDVTAEAIRALSDELMFATFNDKPRIIIVNEAQLVRELKRLLEIIETNKSDIYFIFTSTDKSKFSSSTKEDNKSQETNAMRSRGAYWGIKAISSKVIKDYLFTLLEKFDPDEKVPEVFLLEGLQVIAENAHGNIRQAINDFNQCINSEVYEIAEVRSLLGYEDENEFVNILYGFAKKSIEAIEAIRSIDIEGFYRYSWTILTEIGFRQITNKPLDAQYKEKTAKLIVATGNFNKLIQIYEKTNTMCQSYFNDKVFLNNLFNYYSGTSTPISNVTESKPVKIPKVK